jgi:hypothetical protein
MGWTLAELHGLDQEYDEVLRQVAPKWLGVAEVEPAAGESAEEWQRVLSEAESHGHHG